MAETSGFWNYEDPLEAPEYPAQAFAAYFADFLTSGVYSINSEMGLKVTMSGMTVTVAAGTAFMRGYRYENDGIPALTFTLSAAPTTSGIERIDRIVLKLDIVNETIVALVKKGSDSSSPQAPSLTNTSDVLEMSLAQIRIKTNASTGTVTDERIPVNSLIEVPYADMRSEFEQFLLEAEGDYDSWEGANQLIFDNWMLDIQNILDGSTAGNLLALIETNTLDIASLQTDKMEASRIKLSTQDADISQMQDGDIWIKYE